MYPLPSCAQSVAIYHQFYFPSIYWMRISLSIPSVSLYYLSPSLLWWSPFSLDTQLAYFPASLTVSWRHGIAFWLMEVLSAPSGWPIDSSQEYLSFSFAIHELNGGDSKGLEDGETTTYKEAGGLSYNLEESYLSIWATWPGTPAVDSHKNQIQTFIVLTLKHGDYLTVNSLSNAQLK